MSDSGPNLLVRGVGSLLVIAGVFLIATAFRIRKGTGRVRVPAAMTIYGVSAFVLGGVLACGLGAVLLGLVG